MHVSIWPEGFTSSLSSVFPWKVPVLSIRVPYSSSSCLFAFKIFHEFWWKIPTTEWTEGVGVSKRTRKSQAKKRKHQAKNLIQCIFFSLSLTCLSWWDTCFCKVKNEIQVGNDNDQKRTRRKGWATKKVADVVSVLMMAMMMISNMRFWSEERERPLFSIFFSFLWNQLCEGWRW